MWCCVVPRGTARYLNAMQCIAHGHRIPLWWWSYPHYPGFVLADNDDDVGVVGIVNCVAVPFRLVSFREHFYKHICARLPISVL